LRIAVYCDLETSLLYSSKNDENCDHKIFCTTRAFMRNVLKTNDRSITARRSQNHLLQAGMASSSSAAGRSRHAGAGDAFECTIAIVGHVLLAIPTKALIEKIHGTHNCCCVVFSACQNLCKLSKNFMLV
jgi:hypothetical protein